VPFATSLAELDPELREEALTALPPSEKARYLYTWPVWARPAQLPPEGDWRVWLLLSGRGFGKTRAGGEWVREQVEVHGRKRGALVAPTAADVRDIVVEGESGLLAISPPWFRPVYEPSKRRLTWPNGAVCTLYSADEPNRLRGPQHDFAWCDELASWRYPEAWDMLLFGLRLGREPQAVVTTTPRPTKLIRELIAKSSTVVTRGSTYENRANLAPGFFADIIAAYEGTTLGRQEIWGEVIEDVAGALWNRRQLDGLRVGPSDITKEELKLIVVAIDPAVTSGEESDETGIVVAGVDEDGVGYVLDDLSGRYPPEEWATKATNAYHRWEADRIVGEVNNGGDLVQSVIRQADPEVKFRKVHASRGKYVRAEPLSLLYERGRVHHVGMFGALEDQMCNFTPDMDRKIMGSPDRVDALVWAFYELIIKKHAGKKVATSREA